MLPLRCSSECSRFPPDALYQSARLCDTGSAHAPEVARNELSGVPSTPSPTPAMASAFPPLGGERGPRTEPCAAQRSATRCCFLVLLRRTFLPCQSPSSGAIFDRACELFCASAPAVRAAMRRRDSAVASVGTGPQPDEPLVLEDHQSSTAHGPQRRETASHAASQDAPSPGAAAAMIMSGLRAITASTPMAGARAAAGRRVRCVRRRTRKASLMSPRPARRVNRPIRDLEERRRRPAGVSILPSQARKLRLPARWPHDRPRDRFQSACRAGESSPRCHPE